LPAPIADIAAGTVMSTVRGIGEASVSGQSLRMATTVESMLPDGVYSDGECLWRAEPRATSTFEESVAARELFLDLHWDRFWNPWRMEDQAADRDRAMQGME